MNTNYLLVTLFPVEFDSYVMLCQIVSSGVSFLQKNNLTVELVNLGL